jgi:ABC-type lipoprotein release transport system permease subunit
MMIKTAFKNAIRTPVKTALFFLLIAAVTVFLCLGTSMWSTSQALLDEADSTFETTAVLEYIGKNYPDSPEGDSFMQKSLEGYDFSSIETMSEVLSFERQRSMGGYIEGLKQSAAGAHRYKDYAVILFTVKYDTDKGPRCMIQKTYYASDDYYEGISFYALPSQHLKDAYGLENNDLGLELNHTYIAHGYFTTGASRALLFMIDIPDVSGMPEYAKTTLEYFEFWDEEAFHSQAIEDSPYFVHVENLAKAYAVEDEYIDVQFTSDLESYLEFSRKELAITTGRSFAKEEYESGSEVCVISEHLASQLKLSVGDTLSMGLYGSINNAPTYKSYWPSSGFTYEGDYTIVGLFKETSGYHYTIYVPANRESWLPASSESYTLARLRLKNGTAEAFLKQAEPLLLDSMRFTVYDQGYAETAAALKSMRETAQILTFVCMGTGIAILALFSHLYVSKQHDNVRTMLALGTGRGRTLVYLVSGALLITLLSAAAGAFAGIRFSHTVNASAYDRAVETSTVDFRFSSVYLGEGAKDFGGQIDSDPMVCVYTACGVFAFALLLCAYAALRTISSDRTRKKHKRPRGAGLKALSFPVKLALRSIARGKARSFVVPVVSLTMVALMCLFSGFLAGYQTELEDVYDNMPVRAYITSYTGKSLDKLSMDDIDLWPIMQTGFIGEAHYTSTLRYTFDKVISGKESSNEDDWTVELPTDGFALDTLTDAIPGYEKFILTNDIETVPEFYYEKDVPFTFLEGHGTEDFKKDYSATDDLPCLMSAQFMQDNGISLGDYVRITVYWRYAEYGQFTARAYSFDLLVAGSYPRLSGADSIYVPFGFIKDAGILAEWYYVENSLDANDLSNWKHQNEYGFTSQAAYNEWVKTVTFHPLMKYNAVNFELTNTRELNVFKDKLDELGFSTVGKISRQRIFLVIEDQTLTETVNNLNRHISYMEIVYNAMYALSIGIGFVVSYLLTKTRRSEFAVMRSTGAGAFRTFVVFFTEQAVLCLLGTLLGGAVSLLMPGGMHALRLYAILGYALCYLLGSAVSVAMMNRVNVLSILSAKE